MSGVDRDDWEIMFVLLVNFDSEQVNTLLSSHVDAEIHSLELSVWPCDETRTTERVQSIILGMDLVAIRIGGIGSAGMHSLEEWLFDLGVVTILVMERLPQEANLMTGTGIVELVESDGAFFLAGHPVRESLWKCAAAAEFLSPLGPVAAGYYPVGARRPVRALDALIGRSGTPVFQRMAEGNWNLPNGAASIAILALGPHPDMRHIPMGLFSGWLSLAHVSLEGSRIQGVGARAFQGCAALRAIRMPPSLKYVGLHGFSHSGLGVWDATDAEPSLAGMCFQGCASLHTVLISGGVLGPHVFEACSRLTTLDVGRLRLADVRSLDGSYITEIDCSRACGNVRSVLSQYLRRLAVISGQHSTAERNLEVKARGPAPQPRLARVAMTIQQLGGADFWDSVLAADLSEIHELQGFNLHGCAMLRTAIISPNIILLPSLFFQNCFQLEVVALGRCQRLASIGWGAFSGCVRLFCLGVLPPALGVVSLEECGIARMDLRGPMREAIRLNRCSSLRTLILPRKYGSLECECCLYLRYLTLGVASGLRSPPGASLDTVALHGHGTVRFLGALDRPGAPLHFCGSGCLVLAEIAGLGGVPGRPSLPL